MVAFAFLSQLPIFPALTQDGIFHSDLAQKSACLILRQS